MKEELSQIQKLILYLVMILGVIGVVVIFDVCIGSGNLLIETTASGDNATIDQETFSQYQYSRTMSKNAKTVNINEVRTEDDIGNRVLDSKVNIVGGSGDRMTRYEYRAKSDLGSQEMRITNIKNYDGSALGSIWIDDDGLVNFDSRFDIQTDGKMYVRAVDSRTGKPVTIDRWTSIGEIDLTKHFNISSTKPDYSALAWLEFCNQFSDAIPPNVGIKFVPYYNNSTITSKTLAEIEAQMMRDQIEFNRYKAEHPEEFEE